MDLLKTKQEYKDIEKYLETIGTKDELLEITDLNTFLLNNKNPKFIEIVFIYINTNDNIESFLEKLYYYINLLYKYKLNTNNELNLSLKLIYLLYNKIYIVLNTYILYTILYFMSDKNYIKYLVDLIIYLYENNIYYNFYNLFYYVEKSVYKICLPDLTYSNIITNKFINLYKVFDLMEESFELKLNGRDKHIYHTGIIHARKQFELIKKTILKAEIRGMSINRLLWICAVIRSTLYYY